MRSRLMLATTCALALVGTCIGAATSSAATATGAVAGPTVAATPRHGAVSHRTVTLPTGDRVDVFTDAAGRAGTTVRRPRPGSAPFQTFHVGPHLYVIPRSAAPNIGHSLALSQFDVTAAGTPIVTPKFPMVTLTTRGIGSSGQASDGDLVVVANRDDVRKFFGAAGFSKGIAKFSLPKGHYAAHGIFFEFNPASGLALRLVTLAQFTVSGDSSVTIDARTATSLVSVKTPRPATVGDDEVAVDGSDARGTSFGISAGSAGEPIYLSPTVKPVTVGGLRLSVYQRLTAPDGSYTYDVEFVSNGVITANQHYIVSPGQLATVTARYFSEAARTGQQGRFSFLPGENFSSRNLLDVAQPGQRTEYVTGNPDIVWSDLLIAVAEHGSFDQAGFQPASDQTYLPGQRMTEDWNRQPMHPGVSVDLGSNVEDTFYCPVCRVGDQVGLGVAPFSDNTPGHFGFEDFPFPGLTESTRFTLLQNGQPLDLDPDTGLYPLSPAKARFRMVLDTVRKASFFTLSTKAHTEWGFTSSHADGSGTLPSGWLCPDGSANCAVVPLMMSRYSLPTNLSGQIAAGATRFDLAVEHLQGGPQLPVSSATVSVTYDDGATWVPATVTALGGGQFRVAYTTPARSATNGFVGIKLAAADVAGGTLTQTILRAYSVATVATAGAPPIASPVSTAGPSANRAACATAPAPQVRCFAVYRAGATALSAAAVPQGFGPAALQAAYKLPSATAGAGQTVAVVDAYDDPKAEADLGVYRKKYGLPPCTTANGCFKKVNQNGAAAPLPQPDPGWAVEISLDLDMVSAACPKCKILLVEGDEPSLGALGKAVDTAVRLGAIAVSNSYGTDEFNGMTNFAHHYNHPGTAITVSSGDSGFGPASFPAVLGSVTAVGGTSLTKATGSARGWTERAWDGAGSGCSAYIKKPVFQHDGHCQKRTVADVSAVADPNTGLAVYDSFQEAGWIVVGGTSASSPLIGGIYGLVGDRATTAPGYPYTHKGSLFDVVGGSNGFCGNDYLCAGKRGYDAPTGWGSPNGTGAF